MFDWSDGEYEHTAVELEPAAARLVELAAPGPGQDVLDLGCGTGTVARLAGARGARVVGVDPASRLLEVARGAVPGATFRSGSAEAIPAPDRSFDLVLSSFALIFSQEPERAAAEIARVLRPGGRLVMSSWSPTGGVFAASRAMFEVLERYLPPSGPRPAWGDPEFLGELFGALGGRVEFWREQIPFHAASPEAWFEQQERRHPAWRAMQRALDPWPSAWAEARERSVAALAAANLRPGGMRVESEYLLTRVTFG
jgi:SAM-dependent methyltransferase